MAEPARSKNQSSNLIPAEKLPIPRAGRSKQNSNLIVPDEVLVALHETAGKSSRQIEKLLGNIDHSTVCKRLKHLTPRQSTEIFKTYKADILAEKQRKLMMRGDKLDANSERNVAIAFGIYADQERKERGLVEDKSRPLVMIIRGGGNVNVQANFAAPSAAQPLSTGLSTEKTGLSTDR